MVDFHSHILPNMDDGASSPEMSIQMLRMSAEVGVNAIVASPHFRPLSETLGDFLIKRENALQRMLDAGAAEIPIKVYLGAEIAYYSGISRSIPSLCISGTKFLMIEMPFCKWDNETVGEIFTIREMGFMPILAHIDRYHCKPDLWQSLVDNGILMQMNSEAFTGHFSSKRALRAIREKRVHLLGSDCHNLTDRKPNLDIACRCIREHLEPDTFNALEMTGEWILENAVCAY